MTATKTPTILVFSEHCSNAGRLVPGGHFDRYDADDERELSPDFETIECTIDDMNYCNAKKSSFGWRVASLIAETLGVPDPNALPNDDDDA